MPSSTGPTTSTARLRTAVVLSTTEDAGTVFSAGRQQVVAYAAPFPRPRVERVAPGNLVAIAAVAGGPEVIVWRWFDALVVGATGDSVTLWEPNHGTVVAQPRDPRRGYVPGARAYLSAGLPGAQWWVAGPAVRRGEDADVELAAVEEFFSGLGLWTDPA